jgi:hypothetical protein
MFFYRILFGFDLLVALVAAYFFIVGLTDGSVSSFNIHLWMVLLAGVAFILGGSMFLTSRGYRGRASALLSVLAFPGFCFALFMLLVLILQPRWN